MCHCWKFVGQNELASATARSHVRLVIWIEGELVGCQCFVNYGLFIESPLLYFGIVEFPFHWIPKYFPCLVDALNTLQFVGGNRMCLLTLLIRMVTQHQRLIAPFNRLNGITWHTMQNVVVGRCRWIHRLQTKLMQLNEENTNSIYTLTADDVRTACVSKCQNQMCQGAEWERERERAGVRQTAAL